MTLPMLANIYPDIPITEGIKYTGSKLKLLPNILWLAQKTDAKTVLDGFSGTTRVSQAMAQQGYAVHCNDVAVWSQVFATCYLLNQKPAQYHQPLIDHLNAVLPLDGWFSRHYGGEVNGGVSVQNDGLKKPWQIHNTRKLDGIRCEIENLSLSKVEKAVALVSLMLALDRVDNSIGHFASYLREWAPRAYRPLRLKTPNLFLSTAPHKIFCDDILKLAPQIKTDLAYFDPPYGSNNNKMPASRVRYASYYHLWTSICLFDCPQLFGKAGRRIDSSDTMAASVFEEFRQDGEGRYLATAALEKLIATTPTRWIILSYSSGGRATAQEIDAIINRHGVLHETLFIPYRKNVMAGMKWTHEWLRTADKPNQEFLFLIEKNNGS